MKRLFTTTLTVLLAVAFCTVAFAASAQWLTSVNKEAAILGDNVVVFSAKSGLKTVIDAGTIISGSDSNGAVYTYTQGASGTLAVGPRAITATTVSLSTSSSSRIAATGDIIYEITRGDDPSDTAFIFQGVVTAHAFSDTLNTDVVTRAASNAEASMATGDTIYVGQPLLGTRGTGAQDILPWTVTDDNAILWFTNSGGVLQTSYSASINKVDTDTVFPVGKFGRDYIVRLNSGAGVDGEIRILNGHYEAKK